MPRDQDRAHRTVSTSGEQITGANAGLCVSLAAPGTRPATRGAEAPRRGGGEAAAQFGRGDLGAVGRTRGVARGRQAGDAASAAPDCAAPRHARASCSRHPTRFATNS